MSLSPELIVQKYNQIQLCKYKMITSLCEIVDAIAGSPKDIKALEVYAYLQGREILSSIVDLTNRGQPISMLIYRKNLTSNYDGIYYLTFAFVFYSEEGKVFEDTEYVTFASSAKGKILRKGHKSPERLNAKLYITRDKGDFSPIPEFSKTPISDTVFSLHDNIAELSTCLKRLTDMVGYDCVPERLRKCIIELQELLD